MSIKYDPTVNLGHILTFIGFMVTGAGAYSLLEKRVAILEEKALTAVQVSTEQRAEQKEANREIRTDLKDIQRTVNELRAQRSGTLDRR